jgi:hypothetical protein
MARIFFGEQSEELSAHEKKSKINDLTFAETIPAVLILLPLMFIGLWPKGISEGIDTGITKRYELLEKGGSNYGLPSCCPVDQVFKKDVKNQSQSDAKNVEEGNQ